MENEALLFKKMQLGDWTAFNLFFKEYMEQLYLYAVAFVKDRAAAEDIVQDSFIYLWTNRGKINYGEFYQFNLSSCIRQQNSLTAQFVSFSLANLANIFYPPRFLQ